MRKIFLFKGSFLILLIFGIMVVPSFADYRLENISKRIFSLVDTSSGARQHLILSKKGLVVLDSFWSSITADRFKKQWVRELKRDDFIYNINTVDRLDIFGGNSVYKDITIIGHESFLSKFKQPEVDREIKSLIEMWRWKEDISRKRLATHKPGSKKEAGEKRWLTTCKNRADELGQGFSLVLPNKVYKDKTSLDLGDLNLHLIYFGQAGFDGMSLILIPEEKTVFIPGFILHGQHLAPGSNNRMSRLDVPRWIKVLNQCLNGKYPIEKVVCGMGEVWTRKRALTHLNYITKLWNRVLDLEKEGKKLEYIQKICSLEGEFSLVKEMDVYKKHGDDWVRPQHKSHVRGFFLQHKKLASQVIKKLAEKISLKSAVDKIIKEKGQDKKLYFDQTSFNSYGYELLNSEKFEEAILIFKCNVEMYPKSANAFDSLAEAYMKKGDKKLAIKNFEKSLQLNPKNDNALKNLKILKKK